MKDIYTFDDVEYPRVSTVMGQIENQGLVMWKINMVIDYLESTQDKNGAISVCELETAKTAWKDVSQEALDVGSEVHNVIEKYIKYGRDSIGETSDQVTKALVAFWDWEKCHSVKWLESEKPVFSKHYGYAGTLDAVAVVNGEITVIDFKTAKAIYPNYWMQVMAYAKARQDITLKDVIKEQDTTASYCHHPSVNVQYDGAGGLVEVSYDHIQPESCGILRLDKDTGMPEWRSKPMRNLENEFVAFLGLLQYYYNIAKRRLKNNEFGKNEKY